ncbi:transposase [Nocardia sp. NPDC050710]|uniref:transposase n=1 Tax=Nocardia sp. NPDC050710 TaxID=3157220 RepID=UPI0033E4D709
MRKQRRADELAAEGMTGEQIAAELGVSAATMYNWRRQFGGMDIDAAKELEELRGQNARLKRLLADAELEKDALREIAKDAPIDVKLAVPGFGSRRAGLGTLHVRGIA